MLKNKNSKQKSEKNTKEKAREPKAMSALQKMHLLRDCSIENRWATKFSALLM